VDKSDDDYSWIGVDFGRHAGQEIRLDGAPGSRRFLGANLGQVEAEFLGLHSSAPRK